ncbi:hypothetical protein JXL83_01625 [candidate division WOR-3 bacterium]|nr:hypothetical protein [candidate division WOR-3 bacterium]
MKKLCFAFLVVVLTTSPLVSSNRKGFIAGFTLGPALSFVHAEDSRGMEYDKTHFGMGFDLRIGWAFTNQFSVQYDHKSAIFFSDVLDRELSDEQKIFATIFFPFYPMTFSQNNAGLGMTYYFNPKVPSPYIDGNVGFSIYPVGDWFDDLTGGFGFSLGGGYEFSEHWHFHGALMFGFSSGDETHSDRTSNAVSTILTVGYLFY